MPRDLLVLRPPAVAKMIKNVKKSMGARDVKYIRTPEVRLRWKSNGKNAPKATEILVKVTSPGRHLGGKQTLYASKFIFGKDPAIVTVRPHANEQLNDRGTHLGSSRSRR